MGEDPRTYRMAFSARARPNTFPVKGCSDQASMLAAMGVHFWNRHIKDTVVILK